MTALISRVWGCFYPPTPAKNANALRFGILGAATTAPLSLIIPAKSHPDVIVQAISARDRTKAEAFAKSHGIPEIKDTYQEILDDPNIDCVYIPLPNGLHYEWAVRAIRAGKHVLLEKPSTSNHKEAEILFTLPELSRPNGPVLLEAFHNRFFPAWAFFRSLINPADVEHVFSNSMIPWWASPKESINFNHALSGGTMMAMGTYNYASLRMLFDAEPEECISCDVKAFTDGPQKDCDTEFTAKFRFPNGGVGEAHSTLKGETILKPSYVIVTCKEISIPDSKLPSGQIKTVVRTFTLNGLIHGIFWHRIDVKESFEIRERKTGVSIKKWTENKSHKVYTFKEAGGKFKDLPGELHWMSYRYQLEAFVNKIQGKKVQHWVSGEDSILQMQMIDMAYEKSGLGMRPSSNFK